MLAFKKLLRALPLLGSLPFGACSGDEPSPIIDVTQYEAVQCTKSMISVESLTPTRPFDFLEERWVVRGSDSSETYVTATLGHKCATATNQDGCIRAVDRVQPKHGFAQGSKTLIPAGMFDFAASLVSTSGDTVFIVETADALRSFLGTVDTPEEAVYLVKARNGNHNYDCAHSVRVIPEGFEVVTRTEGNCGAAGQRTLWSVTRSGVVSELLSEKLETSECSGGDGLTPS